ncbi:MAG: ADOP family duplicated permease [Gemmatimonadota bacterium]|nr:ADOP family duplicated permease [Gemmatimonadota bacterium]
MSWVDGLKHRLRTLVHPGEFDRELEEEMRSHLELDAMQQRDPDRARRRFGNRTYYKEETRRMTWLGALDVPRQDLGYAWRSMIRAPGLTVIVVATLALGIGANAATFTLLDRLYLRPPGGVEDPSSLRRVWVEHFNTGDGAPFTSQSMNYPMYREIAAASGDPAHIALFATDNSLRLGKGRNAPKVRGVYASATYFNVLGVRTVLGRFYSLDEDRLGSGAPVAVVSHAFWKNRLGGDTTALGKTIAIGKDVYTVIGVADGSFSGLDLQAADIWIPLASMPAPSWIRGAWWESSGMYSFRAIRRLPPGTAEREFEQRATQMVRNVNRELSASRPDTLMNVYTGSIIEARGPGKPGQELIISTRLGGVAVIVLLIAGANVINLLLARAVRRRREIAVRLALGISRGRLVRLLTTETMLLASIAAIAALLAGWWGGTLLRSLLMPDIEWVDSALDWRVILFTLALTLLSGLIAGVVPAVQASDPQLTTALKAGSRNDVMHRSRLRGGLVVTQAALSVMLLVGAALFVRSLRNVQALDIGFDAGRLLFGRVEFADGESPPDPVRGATMREIAERLEGRPGIETVARAAIEPMRGFSFVTFYSGADSSGSFREQMPTMSAVSPSFFQAAGIRLLRGQGFAGSDADGAPAEVVVNDAMAKLLWPGRNAIGQCMRFTKRENPCYTVVGVVESVRRARVIEEEPAPQFYLPLGNMPTTGWIGSTIIVRARSGATVAAMAELRGVLGQGFPTAEATVTPMTEHLEPEYRPWRLGATLFTAFGLLALLVAIVGIYSTVSYGVSQRTHEFGVRVALGARVGDVLRQVIGEGMRTVAVGVGLGIALALAGGRLIASLLYGIEPSDPAVMVVAAATLLAVAALAALVPAWRAARVDPVTALRAD